MEACVLDIKNAESWDCFLISIVRVWFAFICHIETLLTCAYLFVSGHTSRARFCWFCSVQFGLAFSHYELPWITYISIAYIKILTENFTVQNYWLLLLDTGIHITFRAFNLPKNFVSYTFNIQTWIFKNGFFTMLSHMVQFQHQTCNSLSKCKAFDI